jgi:RNA polymerase sigma-70 factor, ECF subfamily
MTTDTGEFRRLIQTHQRMVYSIALRIVGESGTAEEVAQDVFLELFRSAERLESEDHVRFWLRRVTVHRSTDALRRRAVRPEAYADEFQDNDHTGREWKASNAGFVARLEELLRAMPESLRIPVVLRYQEEMLPAEIAALLNQPLATVKSNLQRGLKLLRRKAAVTMKGYVRESA